MKKDEMRGGGGQARHVPIMAREVTDFLTHEGIRGGVFVDCTLGGGGHAEALLARRLDIEVIGMDCDREAIQRASERLAPFGGRFQPLHGNFRHMVRLLKGRKVDGVVMDLGVSSLQLDLPERGFSFQGDAPLDMRLDRESGEKTSPGGGTSLTAAGVVNQWSREELVRIFREFGEEPRAERMAEKILEVRKLRPIRTTGELADLAARCLRGGRLHPATSIFRAIRVAVNDEMGALVEGLKGAWECLQPRGRMAVISFHSLEDRRVKEQFRFWMENGGTVKGMKRKALKPAREEILTNPRARSAKLRIIEKSYI